MLNNANSNSARFVFVLLFIGSIVKADQINCPILQCSDPVLGQPIDYDLCWKVDETQPMTIMKSHDCDWYIANEKSNLEVDVISTCDFSATNGEFAWVDELTQDIETGTSEAVIGNSQFANRRTEAYCREVAAFNQNLNNGRSCASSFQCKSGNCVDQKCKGLQIGVSCNAHADCAEGLFCEKGSAWPWEYQCAKLRTSYQICVEDTECQSGTYCWYASKEKVEKDDDQAKQCLPFYSQINMLEIAWKSLSGNTDLENPTYEDMEYNGAYCEYGLAFPISPYASLCSQVDKVFHDGEEIQSPYQCDPKDNDKWCIYQYNTTKYDGTSNAESATFSRPCECSMDGDSGFCSTILGTEDFAEGASKIKLLFTQSLCHTLDRGDYRALREECCLAKENEWQEAADWNFKINNWPYINAVDTSVRDCFYKMDKMSPDNLSKDLATHLTSAFQATVVIISTLMALS